MQVAAGGVPTRGRTVNGLVRQTPVVAAFLAAGVLASGWVEGPLAPPGAVVLAAVGLVAGLSAGRRSMGLVVAGVLLVGAGFLGTFGAGMVGGGLFGDSGYVASAGLSDYRVFYGAAYLVLALLLTAASLAILRDGRPPAL